MDNTTALALHMRHLDLRNLSGTTKTHTRGELVALAGWLAPTPLLEATDEQLKQWATGLVQRFTPRSRYVKISRIHGFYQWAFNEEYILSIPTLRLPRPKTTMGAPRPIPEDRLERAIQTAPGQVRAWLVLAAYAGMRCCEIAPLTREQVLDTADPPSIIVHGKGSKDRIVPMCERVVTEMRAVGMPSRGWLWHRMDGEPGYPSAGRVSSILNHWLHDQGIPDTAHSLRHRFASQVQRATGDIQVTAALLGHQNIQNTMIYAAFSNDRAVAAVRSLDRPRA